MSEHDSQHELADELLSAYLDDELSPAERAAVESRLANDPTAQQMLHQLRSVSQSIQRLPLENVGADVRGRILERIDTLQLTKQPKAAADVPPSSAGDVLPKITIFSSRRSWIWATLAVAAGLMIMFLSPGEEKNKQLPAIAKNDTDVAVGRRLEEATPHAARDRAAKVSADSSSVAHLEKPSVAPMAAPAIPPAPSAAPGVATAPPSPPMQLGTPSAATDKLAMSGTAAPASRAPENEGKREVGTIAGGSGGARGSLRSDAQVASDQSAANMPAAAAAEPMKAKKLAASSASDGAKMAAETDSLVVVHVLARPAAIQNRAFDKLLVSNGIDIEAEAVGDETRDAGKPVLPNKTDTAARRFSFSDTKAAQANEPVDMVLVDAPESAVKSCLADLKKDADNYAGVEVEETPNAGRAKQQEQLKEKVGTGLGQYNRGMIPQQQKENFRNQLSYQGVEGQERAKAEGAASIEPANGAPSQLNLQELRRVQQRAQLSDNRGRALRVSQFNAEDLQRAARGQETIGAVMSLPQNASAPPAQQIAEPATKKLADGNLQVLFMLSPAVEPAASTPAEKRAE